MKKSLAEFLDQRKAEVAFRTGRLQASFGSPQSSTAPVVFETAEKNFEDGSTNS